LSAAADGAAALRVAVDGPPCASPEQLGAALIAPLQVRGHPAVHLPASSFWRDASLRLEQGREDPDEYAHWLDADALAREVLGPVADHGEYLPSLRDPRTNRSTREPRRSLGKHGILIVSGEFLLGRGLPFDRIVHLAMSPAARRRHTPPMDAWTLPAFDRYDAEVSPTEFSDVVVRLEDPRRPAVQGLR
jgi:hypothetical protein